MIIKLPSITQARVTADARIPAVSRERQEDCHASKASLGNRMKPSPDQKKDREMVGVRFGT